MRSSWGLVLLCGAEALLSHRARRAPRAGRRTARTASVMICPLAPLAPLWLVGKCAIEARRKFFPDAEPWPRAWEESDLRRAARNSRVGEAGRASTRSRDETAGRAVSRPGLISDRWLEKSINFGGATASAAPDAAKCPVPREARSGLARPEDTL